MKTPVRELRLHRGLVESVNASQTLREGSTKAPRSNVVAMLRDSVMERSGGLRGVSVVAKASRQLHEAFVEPPWLLRRHHGRFAEPSRSFGATLAPPEIRQ